VYDAISKILNKNKILAPKLYQENYKNKNIEVEDFGNETFFKILKKSKKNKFLYFKDIIKLLNQIQSIKDKKIRNFKNRYYRIPEYKNKILIQEANLFCEWYAKKNLSKNKRQSFNKKFKKIIKNLASSLKMKNNTFVHRDFHISNLMLINNRIGVIDSQDALIGNRAYDLASLVDDVRLKTPKILKKKIFNFYINSQKKIDKRKIKNDFEILSILRNLKIIGIFTRLAIRDKKKNYLKLIPYTWDLISLRINQNEIFLDLKKLLKDNFKKNL
jgi:aminoglycoside/choline kinase family phosphotransferase